MMITQTQLAEALFLVIQAKEIITSYPEDFYKYGTINQNYLRLTESELSSAIDNLKKLINSKA